MDLPFVHCHEDDGYQRHLGLLLVEVRSSPEVPIVVPPDFLALVKDFEHSYKGATPLCWVSQFYSSFTFVTARKCLEVGITLNVLV